MDTIKKLSELKPRDVSVVERLFGRKLSKAQDAVLILRDADQPNETKNEDVPSGDELPDWCDMYAGLSDDEVADLENLVLKRSDLARSID
jgi:hypothetical protein